MVVTLHSMTCTYYSVYIQNIIDTKTIGKGFSTKENATLRLSEEIVKYDKSRKDAFH